MSGALDTTGAPAPPRAGEVDAQSAELTIALRRFLATDAAEEADVLIELIADRRDAAARFDKITAGALAAMPAAGGPGKVTPAQLAARPLPAHIDMGCHYACHRAYIDACGEWTSGALKHSATLATLCELSGGDAAPIRTAIEWACHAPVA